MPLLGLTHKTANMTTNKNNSKFKETFLSKEALKPRKFWAFKWFFYKFIGPLLHVKQLVGNWKVISIRCKSSRVIIFKEWKNRKKIKKPKKQRPTQFDYAIGRNLALILLSSFWIKELVQILMRNIVSGKNSTYNGWVFDKYWVKSEKSGKY